MCYLLHTQIEQHLHCVSDRLPHWGGGGETGDQLVLYELTWIKLHFIPLKLNVQPAKTFAPDDDAAVDTPKFCATMPIVLLMFFS